MAARLTHPGFIDAVKELVEFDLAGTPVFQCNGMYIRRLWLRRENEGVHRDCYSNERMRGLKMVLR